MNIGMKGTQYHFLTITLFLFQNAEKKVLVDAIAQRLQEIICEVCNENRWKIVAMEIMPDHVHLFLNVKPTDNSSQIMNRIKGRASHHLRKEFPELLKLQYGHPATLFPLLGIFLRKM